MNTYEFVNKNSSTVIILDADNEEEAWETLAEEVQNTSAYRLEDMMPDEDIPDEEPEHEFEQYL